MLRFLARFFVVIGFVACAGMALAEKPTVFAVDGVALRGYDPVAYFTESKPVKDNSAFSVRWKGAAWHFASAANRDADLQPLFLAGQMAILETG